MNNQMSSLSLSASAPQLSLTQAITHTYTPALHKEPSNRHPWDFTYKRYVHVGEYFIYYCRINLFICFLYFHFYFT